MNINIFSMFYLCFLANFIDFKDFGKDKDMNMEVYSGLYNTLVLGNTAMSGEPLSEGHSSVT